MSKASEKRDWRKAMRQQWRKLDLLIEAYGKGQDILPDGNRVDRETIISEIVARFRPMLRESAHMPESCPCCDSRSVGQDGHHWECPKCGERGKIEPVNHDGPLFDLIDRAMRAEQARKIKTVV